MPSKMDWPSLRELLLRLSAVSPWTVLAIVFALLNLKSLPFAWHLRCITGFLKHVFIHPTRFDQLTGPSALFLPMKIASRVPFLDCDYNLHKSNSTYFTDFDMARLHLLVGLVSSGMAKTGKEIGSESAVSIKLGGTSCNFKREIKPYEGYEIWSRILCWDQKWLYTISHFVKKGSVRPKGYVLQPWRKTKEITNDKKEKKTEANGHHPPANGSPPKPTSNPALFATAIAKYVFKHGRLTIPPSRILQNANLLPPKPDPPPPTPPPSLSPAIESTSLDGPLLSKLPSSPPPEAATEILSTDVWNWDRVERERARGWEIAKMYAGLEALDEELVFEGGLALGCYRDLY